MDDCWLSETSLRGMNRADEEGFRWIDRLALKPIICSQHR